MRASIKARDKARLAPAKVSTSIAAHPAPSRKLSAELRAEWQGWFENIDAFSPLCEPTSAAVRDQYYQGLLVFP
jgi:hypothetical protein